MKEALRQHNNAPIQSHQDATLNFKIVLMSVTLNLKTVKIKAGVETQVEEAFPVMAEVPEVENFSESSRPKELPLINSKMIDIRN